MTKEQAAALYDSGWWKVKTAHEIVSFQLYEERLCMPFDEFHGAVERALGRPVFTHEFAFVDGLRKEFEGKKPRAGISEILALIPPEKRIILAVDDQTSDEKEKQKDGEDH